MTDLKQAILDTSTIKISDYPHLNFVVVSGQANCMPIESGERRFFILPKERQQEKELI